MFPIILFQAVAHAVGLNVGGPVHLQKLGLLSTPISAASGNSIFNIEYLLNVALDKLPFMAFSLSVEKVIEFTILTFDFLCVCEYDIFHE